MTNLELQIQRTRAAKSCVLEKLPDGSSAMFDGITNTVYALDGSAAAAWDACQEPVTLSVLTAAMSRRLGKPVTEEIAMEAVAELEGAGLVTSSGGTPELRNASRRELLRAAGVALPVVLSLTAAEQRAFAAGVGSTTTTTTTAPASIVSIDPNSVSCDSDFNLTITGLNTHFTNSSVITFSSTLISGDSVTANSATSLNAGISVGISGEDGAPIVPDGAQITLTVTTGSEVVTGIITFEGCD